MTINTKLIRDFLTTLRLPSGLSVTDFLATIRSEDDKIHVIFEADQSRLKEAEDVRSFAETALKKEYPSYQILCALLAARPKSESSLQSLQNVSHIVAVASGKGGVGKSTTTVNLAIAMTHLGYKVGILDADIYGPSLPTMMGLTEKPDVNSDKKLMPAMAHGVACMSIGLLIPADTPMVWRGPMVQGALIQLLKDVAWGELDVLLIDMPPGTGDVQLSLAQQANLSGAVIVSTPQDIALIDARKGLAMFDKVAVPILGIIENMSVFSCPNCGHESHIFSHGGAKATAQDLGVPFLGEIPLTLSIRQGADTGNVNIHKDVTILYQPIAQKILSQLAIPTRSMPTIKMK